jgi:ABC-type uncharacterized transport system involved in gliding motility auxiliary subunit
MKINRSEVFKSISYGGLAILAAGYLRSWIQGELSPLDIGLMIGGGALLVIAAAFNLGAIGRFFSRRSSRLGANTIVLAVAVLAILTAVNIVGFRHDKRFDLTAGHLYSLSEQSRKIARGLKTSVDFIYFSNQANPTLSQLMAEYRTQNLNIHYERVDPVAHPDQAKQYGIRSMGEMIAVAGGKTIHLQGTAEEDITNALIQATENKVQTVCFVTGHGEKSIADTGSNGYSDVKDELTKENYKVNTVNLVTSNGVPASCSVLVIAGPTQALFPQETAMVEKYLNDGGKAFILADPQTHTGLAPLFQAWNIKIGHNIVIDASGVGRLFGTGPAVPLVHDYGDSPITENFQGTMTFFPLAQTASIANQSDTSIDEVNLLQTSAASFAVPKVVGTEVSFDPKVDTKGPLTLGVTAERKEGDKQARLVVIGNSTFATNRWVGLQRNGDLFYNTVNWLSREENLISVRPKSPTNRRVTMTDSQQRMLMWFSLAVLPGLFVICGIWIWWRRR